MFQHELPSLKGSEEDCIADFVLRKDARISYPGACSLEFQSIMQILTECLLRWDTKTQSAKGKGILGTVVAFAGADEEQGRKTLHRHWQIWVKEINQTVRDSLFHKDTKTRTDARNTFLKHIDDAICANYGSDLHITHKCVDKNENEILKSGIANNLFKDKDPRYFRQGRHQDLCNDVQGGIMYCGECNQTVSTVDIVNMSLQRWKDTLNPGKRAQLNRPDMNIPLSKARLDIAAYTTSYHMNGGCALEKDAFWGNSHVREILLKYRFEEHSYHHVASCFKKDCECRFMFPFMSTACTYIHEDKGDYNQNETLWYSLDGSVNSVYPFLVLPKRPMGCQFINAHNTTISQVLNCNTNIQIGDASQVFYSTLYTSKSTQEEDNEKQIRMGRAVIKRIKRVLEETPDTISENPQEVKEPSFAEGLSRVLSGLNAATTRNVISATMAHLIPSNNGSRFVYSHEFSDLLVNQMEATLEGQDITVRIRSSKYDEKIITWPESLADDYLHRPIDEEFEQMCLYEMTSRYKKSFKVNNPSKHKDNEGIGYNVKGANKYKLKESHPGYKFSHLTELKHPTIPKISLPRDKLCPIEELDLHSTNPDEITIEKREMYAKMALIMFYPFRELSDLTCIGESYWRTFHQELTSHHSKKVTKFWKKGFEILQNIQDRLTLQKHLKRPRDPIFMTTVNEKPNEDKKTKTQSTDENKVMDILQVGSLLK